MSSLSRCCYSFTSCQGHEPSLPTQRNYGVVVVKFGGSAVTVKSEFETPNHVSINSIAQQILSILKEPNSPTFVLVHGAGSFGHFQASEFGLKNGGHPDTWHRGAALTRQSVLKLNGLIMDSHISLGVPVFSVPLFPSLRTSNRDLIYPGPLLSIENILRSQMIPVLHGDVVMDEKQNCSIFSGDRILLW